MISTTITLADGVKIVAPDSLNLITPYVLIEQQDWFEDEIKFLRFLLKPGQSVIDIGANYGVYTLTMAQTVGKTGQIWAFEPASSTAKFLAEGIAANGFAHVVLERSALSSAAGTARLSLHDNSEQNALMRSDCATNNCEVVPVSSLDILQEKYCWQDIAFMKIDAEGEEFNILEGGRHFFAKQSPLVQYEIKEDTTWHLGLVQKFADFGYDSYHLAPGLNLLVPFDGASIPDPYLLNLFCCKHDCAKKLAAEGFLLEPTQRIQPIAAVSLKDRPEYGWRNSLVKFPYGSQLSTYWEQTMAEGKSAEVDQALSFYAASRDSSLPAPERFAALESSLNLLKSLCERQPSHLRLASLARVARDYGARAIAVGALQQLCNAILQNNQVDVREPFLAPGERFDAIPPGDATGNWILASALEELERIETYSSFYTGIANLQRLEKIKSLGFASEEMARRLALLRKRFDLPA